MNSYWGIFVLVRSFLSRMHTLVLVKGSCEVLSFGLGANGQLGRSKTSNSLQPDPIQGNYWTVPVISEVAGATETLSGVSAGEGTPLDSRVLKGLYAGGDQSFVTVVVNTKEKSVSAEHKHASYKHLCIFFLSPLPSSHLLMPPPPWGRMLDIM